jgi:hypothetical protein
VVRVVRLTVPNAAEEFAIQSFGQTDVTDVVLRNMGVHTRLYIAVGVYVEVPPASGNTPFHMGAVIPEIENEQGLLSSEPHHLASEIISLLWGHHEVDVSLAIDREIEEIHLGHHTLVDEHIDELL